MRRLFHLQISLLSLIAMEAADRSHFGSSYGLSHAFTRVKFFFPTYIGHSKLGAARDAMAAPQQRARRTIKTSDAKKQPCERISWVSEQTSKAEQRVKPKNAEVSLGGAGSTHMFC